MIASQTARETADVARRAPAPELVAHAKTCSCGGTCPKCRAARALRPSAVPVSRPGDRSELEADRVAASVIAATAPRQVVPERLPAPSAPKVAARLTSGGAGGGSAPASTVAAGIAGGGTALRESTRAFMGPRFGRDLQDVRLHSGARARTATRALGALAFTVGSEIVVDPEAGDIESVANRRLLAHELAHVVQQQSGEPVVQRQGRTPRDDHPPDAGTGSGSGGGSGAAAPVYNCGPDVRAQLADVVARTKTAYAGWTSNQKDEACWSLENAACGPVAWDIVEMHNSDWIWQVYQPRGCATTGAHPACGQTVQIGTGCHLHGSANYVIFGVMANLCGMWRTTMRTLIWAYKHSSSNYEASRDWALAGYDGWPAVADPAGDRNNCARIGCPYIGGPFTLHWYPSAFTETVGSDCESALELHRDLRDNPPDYSGGGLM